jgi:hypothetical protein
MTPGTKVVGAKICFILYISVDKEQDIILLEVLLKPGTPYSSGGTPEARNPLFVCLSLSLLQMLYKWNLGGFGPCNGQTLTACQTLTTAREKQSLNNCPRERASCEKIENITNVKYANLK